MAGAYGSRARTLLPAAAGAREPGAPPATRQRRHGGAMPNLCGCHGDPAHDHRRGPHHPGGRRQKTSRITNDEPARSSRPLARVTAITCPTGRVIRRVITSPVTSASRHWQAGFSEPDHSCPHPMAADRPGQFVGLADRRRLAGPAGRRWLVGRAVLWPLLGHGQPGKRRVGIWWPPPCQDLRIGSELAFSAIDVLAAGVVLHLVSICGTREDLAAGLAIRHRRGPPGSAAGICVLRRPAWTACLIVITMPGRRRLAAEAAREGPG
jgi:hypothetical protein